MLSIRMDFFCSEFLLFSFTFRSFECDLGKYYPTGGSQNMIQPIAIKK